MTIVTVDDLHLVENPAKRLTHAANIARVRAGNPKQRLIVRIPHAPTDALHCLQVHDVARLLHRHGRILDITSTEGGSIVGACDLIDRRGEVAIWTGEAIGPWMPTDIMQRGLGGSETAAVRLAENLAAMGWLVTLYGHFDNSGVIGDIMLRPYGQFDSSQYLDALVGFRYAPLFERRPNAKFTALWLEDLAPAEGLTRRRADNIDMIFGVSRWHRNQILEVHPFLDAKEVTAGRNGIMVEWFRDED